MSRYDEYRIEQPGGFGSTRSQVLARPGLFLGILEDGTAQAGIVAAFVDAILNWRIGANLAIELLPGNRVILSCRHPPEGVFHRASQWRPLQIVSRELAVTSILPLRYMIAACSELCWEIRDRFGAGTAVFAEGTCRSAIPAAPDLPADLCTRVRMTIDSDTLPIAPATLAQVAAAVRRVSGPADPAYYGCVTLRDRRTGQTEAVLATTPVPRFQGRQVPP